MISVEDSTEKLYRRQADMEECVQTRWRTKSRMECVVEDDGHDDQLQHAPISLPASDFTRV